MKTREMSKSERWEAILELMREVATMKKHYKNFMSVPEIHQAIGANCNQKTIQRDVRALVATRMLEKSGDKRHTTYKIKSRNL